MKKLSDLFRIISVRRSIQETEEPKLQRRAPHAAPDNAAPESEPQEPGNQRADYNNPADAARKLWCRAYHF